MTRSDRSFLDVDLPDVPRDTFARWFARALISGGWGRANQFLADHRCLSLTGSVSAGEMAVATRAAISVAARGGGEFSFSGVTRGTLHSVMRTANYVKLTWDAESSESNDDLGPVDDPERDRLESLVARAVLDGISQVPERSVPLLTTGEMGSGEGEDVTDRS